METLERTLSGLRADRAELWKVGVLIGVAVAAGFRVVFAWLSGTVSAGEAFVVLVGLLLAETAAVSWARDFEGLRFGLLAALPLAAWAGIEVIVRVGHREAHQSTIRGDMQRYRAALRRDPRNAAARTLLGDSYLRLGRPERAVQEYRAAVALAGESTEMRYKLERAKRLAAAR
jgi:tetratricopeptide (TPR) repeat protein